MIYSSVVSAVVRAMAADVMGSVAQCWRDPREPRAPMRAGEILGAEEALLYDAMVHARLHAKLSRQHWRALVAKYSTNVECKHSAILEMSQSIASPAPARFRQAAIVTWAIPRRAGVEGKRSSGVLPQGWYCMDNWCDEPAPIKTQERWRRDIRRACDDEVNRALECAQEVLDAEGLIRASAA